MAYVTFDFTPSGGDTQTSAALTLSAGEAARVRFTSFDGAAEAWVQITRNGVTSKAPIYRAGQPNDTLEQDDAAVFVAPATNGDTVALVARMNGSSASRVAGILETI